MAERLGWRVELNFEKWPENLQKTFTDQRRGNMREMLMQKA
jgi:hypothetical protein